MERRLKSHDGMKIIGTLSPKEDWFLRDRKWWKCSYSIILSPAFLIQMHNFYSHKEGEIPLKGSLYLLENISFQLPLPTCCFKGHGSHLFPWTISFHDFCFNGYKSTSEIKFSHQLLCGLLPGYTTNGI
jgi:hypothetical protein